MNKIIKQDINFLNKPLWFLDIRNDGSGIIWKDIDGYEYRSGYKAPDKMDMLILFYLMLKSQMLDYKTEIEVSRREVLIGCNLPARDNKYYKRVEDSLKRWLNISIHFEGTFYNNKRYMSIGFHIIDDYKIDQQTKKVTVIFNQNWLLKIKESNFFKYINFSYYKSLKRAISRRLFEILCTKFYGGDRWQIHAIKLGAELGLSKRAVRIKEGKKEVYYASDILVAVKPAINEINRLASIPNIWEILGISKKDLFTITIEITGEDQNRIIVFIRHLVYPEESKKEAQKLVNAPNETTELPAQPLEFADSPLPELFSNISAISTPPPTLPKAELKKLPPVSPVARHQSNPTKPVPKTTSSEVLLPAQLQEQYLAGLAWIEQVAPDFNFKAIQGMDKDELAGYFPKLYAKFEDTSKKGISNPAGFIQGCLQNKCVKSKSKKERQEEKRDQDRKERQEKEIADKTQRKKFETFIETMGGQYKVLYDGKEIWGMDHAGIVLREKKSADSFLYWHQVDFQKITKVS